MDACLDRASSGREPKFPGRMPIEGPSQQERAVVTVPAPRPPPDLWCGVLSFIAPVVCAFCDPTFASQRDIRDTPSPPPVPADEAVTESLPAFEVACFQCDAIPDDALEIACFQNWAANGALPHRDLQASFCELLPTFACLMPSLPHEEGALLHGQASSSQEAPAVPARKSAADATPSASKHVAADDATDELASSSSSGSSDEVNAAPAVSVEQRVSSLHGAGLQANAQGDYRRAYDCFMAAYRLRPKGAAHVLSAANMKLKLAHMAHWEAYRVAQQEAPDGKQPASKERWHAGSTRERKAYMESWELYQEAAALPLTSKQQEMVQEKLAEIQRAVE
jgi:hypothetical protein